MTKIYKTANGKQIDLDLLRKRNELTPAVGNYKVNARGDQLGPGGKIIRKREDVIREHYESQNNTVRDEVISRRPTETKAKKTISHNSEDMEVEDPNPHGSKSTGRARKKLPDVNIPATTASAAEMAEWEEDDDGNFTRKN